MLMSSETSVIGVLEKIKATGKYYIKKLSLSDKQVTSD